MRQAPACACRTQTGGWPTNSTGAWAVQNSFSPFVRDSRLGHSRYSNTAGAILVIRQLRPFCGMKFGSLLAQTTRYPRC